MMFRLVILFICCLVVPYIIGQLPECFTNKCSTNICSRYVQGFLIIVALYEVVEIPLALLKVKLTVVSFVWLSIVLIVTGFIFVTKYIRQEIKDIIKINKQEFNVAIIMLLLLILFQIIFVNKSLYRNPDDGCFSGIAATAYYTDRIFLDDPYIGTRLDGYFNNFGKYGLNGWYILAATLGRLFSIHSTIVMHYVFSVVIIMLSYAVYWNISGLIFDERRHRQIFIYFVMILHFFSIYNSDVSTFFYINFPWMGKGIYGNVLIPAIWYYSILAMKKNSQDDGDVPYGVNNWIWLILLSIVGIAVTSYSAQLTPFLIMGIMIYYTLKNGAWKNLLYYCGIGVPSIIALLILKMV